MDPALEQVCERAVDGALAFHAGQAGKARAFDGDRKMAFAPAVVAGMADVLVAVVGDMQVGGTEILDEAAFDFVAKRWHGPSPIGCVVPLYRDAMTDRKGTRARGGAFGDPAAAPGCAHPGCTEPGLYRAPTARPGSAFDPPEGPPRWQYLCLEHVRAFNAGWNFFAGMDEADVRRAQSPYPTWERATRAFAHNAHAGGPDGGADRVEDVLGVLRWRTMEPSGRRDPALSAADRAALSQLGLQEDATLAEVKATYRRLARRYHPDANSGSRKHEGRFQTLSEAAAHLEASMTFRRSRA
jgi:hypothetical protein